MIRPWPGESIPSDHDLPATCIGHAYTPITLLSTDIANNRCLGAGELVYQVHYVMMPTGRGTHHQKHLQPAAIATGCECDGEGRVPGCSEVRQAFVAFGYNGG